MSETRPRARIASFVDERSDALTGLRAFLAKPLARNVGWLHTLGSLLLFYLALQAVTGVLLAFYYSPSPANAHASLRYAREELVFGRLVHALHRHGAAFIFVTAILHLARTYFTAAYRKPRELVFVSGLGLLILVTLFVFTGQLLPFDQRGYWATLVGLEIASSAPLVGGAIHDLLTGGFGDLGATTLSRFYILHVCVLPLAFVVLARLHLSLLQKAGSAGPMSGAGEPMTSFWPGQAFKDVCAAALGALALFGVAFLVGVGESGPASEAPGGFSPRPEWYFAAHFELLKLLPAELQVFGTFVLPNAAIVFLLLLPFLDRNPERAPVRRKLLVALGGIALLAFVGLTTLGLGGEERGSARGVEGAATNVTDPLARGRALFASHDCRRCHRVGGEGGELGPNLSHVARRLRPDFFEPWIRNPRSFKTDSEMPAFDGSESELADLVAWLRSLK